MITQISFIDRNTADSWTQTYEFETIQDAITYLLDHQPTSIVKDTWFAHIMHPDGAIVFSADIGRWELSSMETYKKVWPEAYKHALETKQRMNELRAQGCVEHTSVEATTGSGEAKT